VILYDKLGTGLSDPLDGMPTLENQVDDLRAVLDATDSQRAALFGISEGGPISALFAATHRPGSTR
jgi:pimeloyl-ACP methyl ester carboxylesterase